VFGFARTRKLVATASETGAPDLDTATWRRTDTLTAHQDSVTHVAFTVREHCLHGRRRQTDASVEGRSGKMENPVRALSEGDTINSCAFSVDGKLLVWCASNSTVRVFKW